MCACVSVCLCVCVCVCACARTPRAHVHNVLTAELDKTEQVRRWTLAREEEQPCSLLTQLWPAIPSTTGVWGTGRTGQAIGRSLDS